MSVEFGIYCGSSQCEAEHVDGIGPAFLVGIGKVVVRGWGVWTGLTL